MCIGFEGCAGHITAVIPVCTYIHIYIYTYIHIYIYIYRGPYIYIYTHTHIFAHLFGTFLCMHVYVYIYIYIYIQCVHTSTLGAGIEEHVSTLVCFAYDEE